MENKRINPERFCSSEKEIDVGRNGYLCFLDGDLEAFSFIIEEYKNPLMLYINTFVGNIHLAEELTQETFVQLGLKKPDFKGRSSFKTFLFAIGRNITLSYLRRNPKRRNISEESLSEILADERSVEEEYLRNEDAIILHRALSKIQPQYRQILWLTFFEGLSNSEAAVLMKKTKHGTETLKYRAEKALKTQLEKEGFIYENR